MKTPKTLKRKHGDVVAVIAYVTPEAWEKLRLDCFERGSTMSSILGELIGKYLDARRAWKTDRE